ncbi:SET domain-containing protein-lysine N-methyltransferase [Nannocystis sp.]|uniref:SET domain-containing protein-lysine N-methyltransferase n=1 Tax=Nannocystis sp. TaxID=1962667 RepID=UPI0025E01036|nr:SET domain-containing protein-lysine N-methyltransferase [Nannocystis sp.]
MRICVLTSSYARSSSEFREVDPLLDPSPWLPDHTVVHRPLHKATAASTIRELAREGFDLFINLCDGTIYEDVAGPEVVQELERQHQAFTGASSDFYDPSRQALKQACERIGADTPHYFVAEQLADVPRAAARLRFPLIVKPGNGYGSVGIAPSSRVETPEALHAQVASILPIFQTALIEEFIAGREFNVLVAESIDDSGPPQVYAPVEVGFPAHESFLHFDLKWREYRHMAALPVTDAALAARLEQLGQRLFTASKGSGYCRLDVRMDADGRLFVLDINPNASLFYPPDQFGFADSSLAQDPAGHRGFLAHIMACALRRQQRERPTFKLEYDPATGHGLVAARDIAAGEIVRAREQQAHHLVSRAHAERGWHAEQLAWSRRHAQPISDDLFITWPADPEGWLPVQHSCDPNLWFSGLDWVARRPIDRNQALTLDYATCGALESFACRCGTTVCRGVVRPDDHLAAWAVARYGDHVTDYVRRARAGAPRP